MFNVIGGPLSESYFFGLGYRISFSKTVGTVCRYPLEDDPRITTLPLKIPFLPREMAPEDALYKEKTVKWFLSRGYTAKLVDNDTKIALLQESSVEQDLKIQQLLHKCVQVIKIVDKFARYSAKNNSLDPSLKSEEYEEWRLFQAKNPDEFTIKIELLSCLLEGCRQLLRNKEWAQVHECLENACCIAPESFGLKDLLADVLAFHGSKEAAKYYLELSGNKSGEASLLYLEKAMHSNPESQEVADRLASIKCSAARALHCYLSAYVACPDKDTSRAVAYATNANGLNKRVNDAAVVNIVSRTLKQRLDQSQTWKGRELLLTSASSIDQPRSPRMGVSRVQTSCTPTGSIKKISSTGLKTQFLRDKSNLKALEGLLWWYHEKENWLKTEYVARLLLESIPEMEEKRYTVGSVLAKAIKLQGRFDEAERLNYELAKHEYASKRESNALLCLLEISRSRNSFGVFSLQECRIIYLLLLQLKCEDVLVVDRDQAKNVLKAFLQNSRTPRIAEKSACTITDSRNHFGKWAWFQVDHPDYVAVACTMSKRFLFRKNVVEVFSVHNDESHIYPLKFPQGVSDEDALFGANRVRALLSEGYNPHVVDGAVEFVKARTLCKFIAKLPLASTNLQKCKECLEAGSLNLAFSYLYKAYQESRQSAAMTELLGEFLLLYNKPQFALKIFKDLAEVATTEELKLRCIKHALIAAYSCKSSDVEVLYKRYRTLLLKKQSSEDQIQLLALHGYLYFRCHSPVKEETMNILFNKAENNGHKLLAPWAQLACQESVEGRKECYQMLQDKLEGYIEHEHVRRYYQTKKDFEEPALTPTLVERAARGRSRPNMKMFVAQNRAVLAKHPKLLEVCVYADNEQYEKAENTFLEVKGLYSITKVQSLVIQLYNQWVEFARRSSEDNPFGPFFLSASFKDLIKCIKHELAIVPSEHIARCIVALDISIQNQDFDAAKDCILQANRHAEPSDIQNILKQLFISYQNTPLQPGWRATFDLLFADVLLCIDSDPCLTFPAGKDGAIFYLEQAKRATGKLIVENEICLNSVATQFSSLKLYYLEQALSCADDRNDDMALEVYDEISAKLEQKKDTKGERFLLYLHAYFYFKRRQFGLHAAAFLAMAETLNPQSLLVVCAKIAQLPDWAVLEKVALYNKVVGICESEKRLEEYLRTQQDFIVASALEASVKASCKAILDTVDLAEKRRALVVVVDSLIAKGFFDLADKYLKQVDAPKRAFVLNVALAKPLGVSKALRVLQDHYRQVNKQEKLAVVVHLLDKRDLQSEPKQIEAFLAEGKTGVVVKSYLESAFICFRDGKKPEAIKYLQAFLRLDPECEHLDVEDRLIFELLQAQLNLPMQMLEKQLAKTQLE